ncbi:MAG: DNA-binding response regulator [Ignavibacteriae bacterium]|nr:MAG: DNA-binding response regulator [Ignavibacteriota bacterium]
MTKIRTIIIDDEAPGRENLKIMLNDYCPDIELVGEASSAVEGMKLINSLKPKAVFTDINMPIINGFDMLETISKRDFSVVFVTAHSDYGIQALKAGAVDYILKPICVKELQLAVKKLVDTYLYKKDDIKSYSDETRKLKVPQFQGFTLLDQADIVRLEADNNYTKIYVCRNPLIIASKTLKDFEFQLDRNAFLRIHKSHIINLNYLKEYTNLDGGYAIMCDNTKLEISRRRLNDFLEKIKAFTAAK